MLKVAAAAIAVTVPANAVQANRTKSWDAFSRIQTVTISLAYGEPASRITHTGVLSRWTCKRSPAQRARACPDLRGLERL